MKITIYTSLLCFIVSACLAQGNPFEPYIWKNRILVIYANKKAIPIYEKQQQLLKGQAAEFIERDLISISLSDSLPGKLPQEKKLNTFIASCKKFLSVREKDQFLVTLIGKDGTIKLQQNEPLSTEKLFATIDAMPMRQREMRKQKD